MSICPNVEKIAIHFIL